MDVLEVQLPEVSRLCAAGELSVENVDVFCERGVFDVGQARRVLQAGADGGMRINFHGEELACLGSAEVGRETCTYTVCRYSCFFLWEIVLNMLYNTSGHSVNSDSWEIELSADCPEFDLCFFHAFLYIHNIYRTGFLDAPNLDPE